MMSRTVLGLVILAALTAARPVRSQEITIDSALPVVVKTVPVAGTTGVDPALKEIRVTFSKTMTDGNWSAVQLSPDSFPKIAGKLHYDRDGRTFVLPASLEPGRVYAIWINSSRFQNFKDRGGQPAVPYLIVFENAPR
jgi:RNA polymerase sigma-70 factor (ECF subfamily)